MVKRLSAWIIIGSLPFLGFACKKDGAAQSADPLQASFQKLRAELVKASPQVQSNLYNHVDYSLRYENYVDALMYLDAIANDPSLNDKQKKAANDTIELLKAKAQGAGAPKPPAAQ